MGGVIGALVLGLAAGKPVGDDVFTYLWADDRFCDDCHVHDYANEAFTRSAHVGMTTCHDCHRVPIRHYPRNLWVMVFDRPQGPEDIDVPHVANEVCEDCHSRSGAAHAVSGPLPDALRAQVVKIDDSSSHRAHLDAEAGEQGPITCMSCHGSAHNRAHQFRTDTDTCLDCHSDMLPGKHQAGALPCRECHFLGFAGQAPAP